MENLYISVSEAASISNKSIKTIRRAIAANEITFTRIQNQIRIDKESFSIWLNLLSKKSSFQIKNISKNQRSIDEINWVDISKDMKKDYWNKLYSHRKLNFIDLFSGAGGISLGLVMAGFKPLASVEIMPEAIETYKHNFARFTFNENTIHSQDIREKEVKQNLYNSVKNKHIHLITGGFPCQGFSMAGHRIVTDSRNNLYTDMLEIVSNLKPDFVLMENVEGLRSMLGGMIEKKILEDYKNIGYEINVTVLNSADYGVPQIRKRVIFIGNRLGIKNYHPKPFLIPESYKTVKDGIDRFLEIKENSSINHIFTRHNQKTILLMKELAPGKSLYGNYSDAWKKTPYDQPSCTVKENHGGVNIHPIIPRVMTPRELASLQSFPDDFIFKGSKKWQLVQIGNAVPPLLAKAIGISIKKSLKHSSRS
jgi:DNA (cytosine-5)-methyltransferase 1